MHGPLDEIGLIEVIQLLERGGRSGVLRVTGANPDRPRQLHLQGGTIVALEPDAGDRATRAALVARHLVADSEAEDPAVIDRPVARDLQAHLARQMLGTMLHWRRGRFDFEEGPVAPGPLALSPDALVFGVVEAETRRVDLAGTMSNFRAIPSFAAAEEIERGEAPVLSPLDWRVLDAVDGVRDVAALAAALDEPLEDVGGCVQALQSAAILDLRPPEAEPARVAQLAIEAGRYEEAIAMLRPRLADDPDDADAWRALGLAEVGAGRFEHAIDAWQHWRANDPDHAGDAAALMQAARTMVEALRDSRD